MHYKVGFGSQIDKLFILALIKSHETTVDVCHLHAFALQFFTLGHEGCKKTKPRVKFFQFENKCVPQRSLVVKLLFRLKRGRKTKACTPTSPAVDPEEPSPKRSRSKRRRSSSSSCTEKSWTEVFGEGIVESFAALCFHSAISPTKKIDIAFFGKSIYVNL